MSSTKDHVFMNLFLSKKYGTIDLILDGDADQLNHFGITPEIMNAIASEFESTVRKFLQEEYIGSLCECPVCKQGLKENTLKLCPHGLSVKLNNCALCKSKKRYIK